MRFALLGPLEVTTDLGEPVDVGGRQPRVVLAMLVAAGGGPVSAERLIEAVWGDAPPSSATGTLQSYVSRLRRALGDGGAPSLIRVDGGYRLDPTHHSVDIDEFEQLASQGHELLGDVRPGEAHPVLEAALALWRGPALVELVDRGIELARAAALEDRRLAVVEDRLDVDLERGGHVQVVAELQELVDANPWREGLHARLALALYRSGRQAEALRAVARATRLLRDELGLEPGRELRELERSILVHDPALDLPLPSRPDATAGTPATAVPFVGREQELAEVLAAYEEAAADARFVVIEGEPGIGKTRLAEQVAQAATASGSPTVWGRSNECGAAPALWPWLPVLRGIVPSLDEVPSDLGDLLAGEAPLLPGQGGAVQFHHFDAIAGVLERAGRALPVVVVLDDLQWADPASLDLLQFLTMRLQRGVLVVVTVRELALDQSHPMVHALGAMARRPGSRRLRLRGLSIGATEALLASLDAQLGHPDVAARIHSRSDGNPFYAIELARLVDRESGRDDEVPGTVRDAIRRRLAVLPEDTLDVMAVAATTGRDVDLTLVARAARLDTARCAELLDPATAHRLLVEAPARPGQLRFSHALVREVLLDGLTPLRRARLHLQVADAIAGDDGDACVGHDEAEVLAEHLWRAASLGVGERAAAALERAADTAVSRVAYTAAEDLLRRAAELRRAGARDATGRAAELGALLRLLEVMRATRYFSGTDRDVLHRAQELAGRLGREGVTRNLAWSEWAAMSTAARLAEARPMAVRYLDRWGDDPRPDVAGAAHTLFGVDEWSRGNVAAAVEHLDRAAALLESAPPAVDPFRLEHQLVARAFGLYSHAAHGDITPAQAFDAFEVLFSQVPPVALPAACAFAGAVAAVHACWDELEGFVTRALATDPSSQFAFFGGQLLMFRGLVAASRGDHDAGVADFIEGRNRFRSAGGRAGTTSYQALLGELLARGSRVTDAAELVSGARRLVEETGEAWNEVTVCIAEGTLAAAAGDRAQAVQRLRAAVAVGDAQGAHALARRADRVWLELGLALDDRDVSEVSPSPT